KPAATNAAPLVGQASRLPTGGLALGTTNAGGTAGVAGGTPAPLPALTGNEPPEELARRVREMRDRGEEPPPEIRAKLRELFQSGALQRPAVGGGGPGGGPGGGGGAGAGSAGRNRPAQPSWRTLYVLSANPSSSHDAMPKPQPV